jgi:hypothetical protein
VFAPVAVSWCVCGWGGWCAENATWAKQWRVRDAGEKGDEAQSTRTAPRWLTAAAATAQSWWVRAGASAAAEPPWCEVHSYPHIQQGRAQLAVADLRARRAQQARRLALLDDPWACAADQWRSLATMGVQALVVLACAMRPATR